MSLLRCLSFFLILFSLIVGQEAIPCPKGQRLTAQRCVDCPADYFQPTKGSSSPCHPCRVCHENQGSYISKKCTKESNAECQCRPGFVPWTSDSSACKCDIGFGKTNGECSECEVGYFNSDINKPCKKWRICTSGVNVTGSRTRDVVCNNPSNRPSQQNTKTTRPPQSASTAVTTAAGSTEQEVTNTRRKEDDSYHSGDSKHKGVILFLLGIIPLVLLTAVVCKKHIFLGLQTKAELQTKEPEYRPPVEESGDGSEATVKLNLNEL